MREGDELTGSGHAAYRREPLWVVAGAEGGRTDKEASRPTPTSEEKDPQIKQHNPELGLPKGISEGSTENRAQDVEETTQSQRTPKELQAREHDKMAGTHAEEGVELIQETQPASPCLRNRSEMQQFMSRADAPDVLVAFEFTGALREALRKRGVRAISADLRETQQPGPHYQGDVRDIVEAREWEIIYFVGPNCYQTLRRDEECLPLKLRDGRAYWGIAMVVWCLSRPNAKAILVEQPDTIANDYIQAQTWEDTEVHETRTSHFGDADDKFMRFTTRNLEVRWPTASREPAGRQGRPRSQFMYATMDQRDRERSSWLRFPKMCQIIASSRVRRADLRPSIIDYQTSMLRVSEKWLEDGLPLPWDFLQPDARPATAQGRQYQLTRGRGDGRDVTRQPRLNETKDADREGGEAPDAEEVARYLATTRPEQAEVIVVPIQVEPGITYALTPTDPTHVFTLRPEAQQRGASATERVQQEMERIQPLRKTTQSIRVGATKEGKPVIAAVTGHAKMKGAKAHDATQRRGLSLGRVALWCAMGALMGGAPQTPWTQLAVCAVKQYAAFDSGQAGRANTEQMARDATGARPGKGPLLTPAQSIARGDGKLTPRKLIERANEGLQDLRVALWTDTGPLAEYYRTWSDAMRPMPLAEVPEGLLDKPLDLSKEFLVDRLFAERLPTYKLPWIPRMPEQKPLDGECAHFNPQNAGELLDEEAREAVRAWVDKSRKDLKCLEERGAECERTDRPDILVIGEERMHPCARKRVWDCRAEPCTLLNYSAPIDTHWDLDYLRRKFEGYPDQRLASNVLEGVRLEADVEHQIVLHPNLMSVGEGYDSVQKTVRELADMGFYDFHERLPFIPVYVIGQGSRVKKVGVRKYRRTSNFSAPHKTVKDRAGRKVIAVNDASKCYFAPQWLVEAEDARIRRWDKERYAHVKWRGDREAHVRHKFPKEGKPTLLDVMVDFTQYLGAALELGQHVFITVEDAAFYFNQFGYAPEEYWKSALVLGARKGDNTVTGHEPQKHEPLFIAEKRLGFGSFASSNIAQRFSNAVVTWTLERFDELEREAGDTPQEAAWRERRRPLEEICRRERPTRPDRAPADCNQTRLATIHMYTDDPVMIVVGTERAKRLLAAWHEVTGGINITMAGTDKRQIGAHVEWIGAILLVGIGIIVVPRNKLLRAYDAITRTLEGNITFGEYRALVGLLEHLRFIARLEADTTNALYRPHGAGGEGEDGPNATIRPDALMIKRLEQWKQVIMSCGGALCTMVFTSGTEGRVGHLVYAASADAAGDGRGTPGIGGYMHGSYWRVSLSDDILGLMHITAWETLATAVNILVAGRLAGKEPQLQMRADAAMVPHAIVHHRSRSKDVQTIIYFLQQQPRYTEDARKRLAIEHMSGESNVFSDLVSRGLWDELDLLCAALHIKATEVLLDENETQLIRSVLEAVIQDKLGKAESKDPRATHLAQLVREALKPNSRAVLAHRRGTTPQKRQRPGSPNSARTLTALERGTHKARSDCTDGDGPFTPPWEVDKDDQRAPSQKHGRTPTLQTQRQAFIPPWADESPTDTQSGPAKRPREPTHERTAHPRRTNAIGAQVYLTPTGQRTLMPAERQHAENLVQRLVQDRSPGRIAAPEAIIRGLALEVAQARADGTNPRTAKKDQLAWREFCTFAELRQFDPNLCTAWTRAFPERETLKLAGFVLFTAQRIQPRAKATPVAKPMSVHHRYLALRRIFKQRGEELPAEEHVQTVVKGLIRRFIRSQGIESLRPQRVEPITLDIVRSLIRQARAGTLTVKGTAWRLDDRDCRNITTWQVANLQIGSRKGESTKLPGDIDGNDWFTWASLTAHINKRTILDPTDAELKSMTNADYLLLAPKGAKCDQWGTCHGTEPIVLPFRDDELNPAKWLRDLALAYPCHGDARHHTPLFARSDGQPYTDGLFSQLVRATLEGILGITTAKLYSPHSWRVWLATALRARGASDARIQAFGRWLNPDSIKIYARLTVQEYTLWQDKIMTVHTFGTARTTSLPVMDAADAFSSWHELQPDASDTGPIKTHSKKARLPTVRPPTPDTQAASRPRRGTKKANRGARANVTHTQLATIDYKLQQSITPNHYPDDLEQHQNYYQRHSRPPPRERYAS